MGSLRLYILLFFSCVFVSGCGLVGYRAHESYLVSPVYYRVRAGDTLYSIGARFGISQINLALRNGIRNPRELKAGSLILVSYRGGWGSGSSRSNKKKRSHGVSRGLPPRYSDGKLGWPVAGGRVVSRFGTRKSSFHDGIDIAAPSGTPVYASHSGQVVYSGHGLRGYGNLIIVKNQKKGISTVYAHNRRLLVRKGRWVRRGQKIAEVGSTGRATGPHLHFEVRQYDWRGRLIAVDPLPYFRKGPIGKPRYRVNESLSPILARLDN